MLSQKDDRILRLFSKRVRERFPDARIYAYGSRVRGRARKDSDLDVCVVLQMLDDSIDREVMRLAWEVGFDNDRILSTVTYSRKEFEESPSAESPFVRGILSAGMAA